MEEKVLLSDIASELGLSTATVSYVLHGKTGMVSERTANRVRQALEERGYLPRAAEVLLAENPAKIVGVVINDHEKYEAHILEDAWQPVYGNGPYHLGACHRLSQFHPSLPVWDSKVVNSVCSDGANSEVKSVYDQISSAMNSFNILPSFANPLAAPPQQYEMQYNDGTYSLTLTDPNGVLSNYNVTCTDSNVSLSASGNTLTLTSSVPISGATVNLSRKSTVSPGAQIIWNDRRMVIGR